LRHHRPAVSRTNISLVERAYRSSTFLFAALTALLGMAIVVQTLVQGYSAVSGRFIIGAAFFLIGALRIYLMRGRRGRRARS
jgi:hypothetical protein